MTAADPCTGARWRDFLLGIRRGQPVGAHVPSWCSRHGVDGWSLPTGGPAWLAYDFCLPDSADGTGVDGWSLPTGGPAWLAYDFCLPDAADGTGVDEDGTLHRLRDIR